MKKSLLILALLSLLLTPALARVAPDCQQGCLAAATAFVYECANNGGTNCTQRAHSEVYCPCMGACSPNPAPECGSQ